MKFFDVRVIVLTWFFLPGLLAAQIPNNPNKVDEQGRRQGTWTILFDANWQTVTDTANLSFYRVITYQDDKPLGMVYDYFKNGQVQFSGGMLEDRPQEIFNGIITWYNRDGSKGSEAVFDQGQLVGELKVYYSDGSMIKETLETLNESGINKYNEGKLDEALIFLEKASLVAYYEFGQQSNAYAYALENLSFIYFELKDYAKVERICLEAINIVTRIKGKENESYLLLVKRLAEVYYVQSEYTKAEPWYEQVKEITATITGKNNEDYVMAINSLEGLYFEMADYSRAEPFALEVQKLSASLYGKESENYANAITTLGAIYYHLANYSKAEPLLQEALNIKAKVSGKDNARYASALIILGAVYDDLGNYLKAEALYLEAQQIQIKVLGNMNLDYALTLNNLSVLYNILGDFLKAESLCIEAKDIRYKLLGRDHPLYATSLNNLAQLYIDMGNYSKAESFMLEALEIQERVAGKENTLYADLINNLAIVYEDMDDDLKAEPLYLEAIEIRKKVQGKDHLSYATSLLNLAQYYSDKDYSKAEPLFLESIEIQARGLQKETPLYAISINNLAGLYSKMGDYPKAEPLYLESMQIRLKVLGKEHPSYAASLMNLASVYDRMGNDSKAESFFLTSIKQIQQHISRYFPSLSEKEKQDFYSSNRTYFSNFEIFCAKRYPQNPAILSELYNVRLATKGLLFNASNKIRQRILGSKDQSLIDQFQSWQSKKDFLVKVYQMTPDEKAKNNYDEKKLEEEANVLEKQLSLKSELFSTDIDSKQYQWGDILKKLKPGEAAVELVSTIKVVDDQSVPIYLALIVTPQTLTHPEAVMIENGADLEGKFSRYYRNSVMQKNQDDISYNQFWKPIADKLKGVHKVYFSADGVYNQININALYNPATGKYVIDEMEVQVVTSTKDILVMTKTASTAIQDVSLFGYPDYNNAKTDKSASNRTFSTLVSAKTADIKSDTSQRFFNGENITELPGTKVEVESIETLLKKKNIVMHEYLFDKATEGEVKRLDNPNVLHIATHGFFLSDLPDPNDQGRGFAGMETKKVIENPLLRSGLLFAGVKEAFSKSGASIQSNTEDGILTAYEAMSLNLDKTDLVVLSACETGLGVSANGEGVYGLQRAFQVAGAKSVLMSLWTVSDEATQQLMTMFYENWLNGKVPREAFRMAQLSLRDRYPEPYYWGAFVLVGN
jgi:CHAT domain-containing protein/tetratricopeptide (TPR) repeat protein